MKIDDRAKILFFTIDCGLSSFRLIQLTRKKCILAPYLGCMRAIYSFLMGLSGFFIRLSAFFSPKMKLFVAGRKEVFPKLQKHLKDSDKTLWMHCASLGEYEQGLPVLKELRKLFPSHKIVLTFFSPSGYEVKKNNAEADVVCYMPLDTLSNAKRFVATVHPDVAMFVKYEIWPNFLLELQSRKIPALLVSGLFRPNQIYFRSEGGWMRKILKTFHHFFVQNQSSKDLLESIAVTNVTVSGDTRFDRVSQQLDLDNRLAFVEEFLGDHPCIVIGSSWAEDMEILNDFINTSSGTLKFIIAPHEIKAEKMVDLQKKISKKSLLFSQKKNKDLSAHNVLIVDTIGLLSSIYSYADIAYVGGGMGAAGLHNVLEPATFGVPVVIGKNYQNFPEAVALQKRGGLFSVSTKTELAEVMHQLMEESARKNAGKACKNYIMENKGATQKIVDYISKFSF